MEYTKPPTLKHVPVTITNNTSDTIIFTQSVLHGYFVNSDGIGIGEADIIDAIALFPNFDSRSSNYRVGLGISADSDKYAVTLNGNSVSYSTPQGYYSLSIETPTYPTEYSVVISDK